MYNYQMSSGLTVCFYLGYARLQSTRYGSELALMNIATQMNRKYNVYLIGYDDCETVDEVKYIHVNKYKEFQKNNKIDVLIISRYINFFLEYNVTADKVYVWIHDNIMNDYWKGQRLPQYGKYLLKNVESKITGYVCLTDWHKHTIANLCEIDLDKIHIIGNGVPNLLSTLDVNEEKVKNRFIYVSDPSRGLVKLVEYFKLIREQVKDAELYIYRSLESFNTPQLKQLLKDIENSEYIHYGGWLENEKLLLEIYKVDVWFYPTNVCESYCTSALEAMYCGCLCIASNCGSLKDVVSDRGVLINSPIYSEQYKKECMDAVVRILNNDSLKHKYQQKGKEWAINRTWDKVYTEWESLLF